MTSTYLIIKHIYTIHSKDLKLTNWLTNMIWRCVWCYFLTHFWSIFLKIRHWICETHIHYKNFHIWILTFLENVTKMRLHLNIWIVTFTHILYGNRQKIWRRIKPQHFSMICVNFLGAAKNSYIYANYNLIWAAPCIGGNSFLCA